MTKKSTPQPAHELFVEVDKILARIAKQAAEERAKERAEDRKRAAKERAKERAEDRKRAAKERAKERAEDRKRAAKEREEDRKRAAKEREEDRKRIAKENEEYRKRAAEERAKERAEDRKRERERDEKIAKEREEDRKHAAKVREEYERRLAKTEALVDKNAKYIGTHANNEGELLEIECRVKLMKMGKLNGVTLDAIIHGSIHAPKYGGVEVDLVGLNGKVVFPMEVKRTMSPDDVRRFADVRVERFKKAFPYAKGREVRPVVIFGAPRSGKSKEDPVQVALELGLIVMQVINENQLTPITDPSQVVKRQHKED